jgi:hypothetical protein
MLFKDISEIRLCASSPKTQVQDSFECPAQHQFESQGFVCLISSVKENKNADL